MKKALLWLVLLGGIGAIIATFLCFDLGFAADNVRYLSLVASVLAYALFFSDLIVPSLSLDEKSQKSIAGLGIRWFVTLFYAVTVAVAVVVMNMYNLSFAAQAIIHAILLLGLVLSIVGVMSAISVASSVHKQEQMIRQDITDLKGAIRRLKIKMTGCELPEDIITRINLWNENLRYLSPSKSDDAHQIEQQMTSEVEMLERMVSNYTLNETRILKSINTLEGLYTTRKSIY